MEHEKNKVFPEPIEMSVYPTAPPPYESTYGIPENVVPTTSIPPMTTFIPIEGPIPFGPDPVFIKCPQCHSEIITSTKRVLSSNGWIISVLLCISCPFVAWIPYCLETKLHDTIHSCSYCLTYLGRYKD